MSRTATMPAVMQASPIEMAPEMDPVALLGHEDQGRGIIQSIADKMAGTSLGRKVLGTAVGLAGVGMTVGPTMASAESGNSTTSIVNTETGVSSYGSHAWQKDGDHDHVTVMGNHRIVSEAKVKQMEEAGDCRVFNGKKVKIYTEGHNTSGTAFGRDKRKSEFCRTDQDFNGDGKADWVRARCGNAAIIGVTPEGALEEVLWLGGKGKFRVDVHSKATAEATCTTPDGTASASAQGFGEASAHGFVKLHGGIKLRVEQAQGAVDAAIDQSISGHAGAKSKAFAIADAQCNESVGNTPPPPPTTPPKDGTPGQGTTSPGQPGGGGSGGDPGQGSGGECRNDAGDLVPGSADQFGNCV
jgi:hypothetical protein